MMIAADEDYRDRIFRSATFEGMADERGFPTPAYLDLYRELAQNGVKHIITGCAYVSRDGMMVQPGQAGVDADDKITRYQQVTDCVHGYGARIYLQISHAGRQTSSSVTGAPVIGASRQRSPYFSSRPKPLSIGEINAVIAAYASAAQRAKRSGFDGVQIHAAHGYLAHQFLHPAINDRKDEYGISADTGIGDRFLRELIRAVRNACGDDYPILVKVSASDDLRQSFSRQNFKSLIRVLDEEKVSGIEISYGTMEQALGIFRGKSVPLDAILAHNFRYTKLSCAVKPLWKLAVLPVLKRRLPPFCEGYNLPYARLAKSLTAIPIICVGGFRSAGMIREALSSGAADFISLCRPFICEPDLLIRLEADSDYSFHCELCNLCAVMCDSPFPTRCYRNPSGTPKRR